MLAKIQWQRSVLQGGKQKAHPKTWKNEHDEIRIKTLIKPEINN
jgi:hypothetical protein